MKNKEKRVFDIGDFKRLKVKNFGMGHIKKDYYIHIVTTYENITIETDELQMLEKGAFKISEDTYTILSDPDFK